MTVTTFTCPHCGDLTTTEMPVYAIDFDNGCPPSYFPATDLEQRRERHIDTRLCCQDCWNRAGKVPALTGNPHPYGWRCHGARLNAACGTVIGSKPVHKE